MRPLVFLALLLFLATRSAQAVPVSVPGLPPPGPHLHYEILTHRGPLTDADRLQNACDFAHYLNSDLKRQNRPYWKVVNDVRILRSIVCVGEKSN
jgi:hypothetical protein